MMSRASSANALAASTFFEVGIFESHVIFDELDIVARVEEIERHSFLARRNASLSRRSLNPVRRWPWFSVGRTIRPRLFRRWTRLRLGGRFKCRHAAASLAAAARAVRDPPLIAAVPHGPRWRALGESRRIPLT